MKPSDIRKLVQSQLKNVTNEKQATKYFEKQKSALTAIKNTSGNQEIRDYFYRLYDDSSNMIGKVDPSNLGKVASLQSQMNVARDFLSFLDNMQG